jgi:predicted ester cyclase
MRKNLIVVCYLLLLLVACNTNAKNDNALKESNTAESANASKESKEERNKQIALESIKATLNNNPDEALKNATADAVDYYDGSGPPAKGVDSIKAGMKMWLSNVSNYKGDELEAVADGNKVFVYGDWSGTFKEDFMGMKVKGKSFKAKDVDIFTFNDEGKITEHRSVQSMAGMMAATQSSSK